jgi:hypothetical protein
VRLLPKSVSWGVSALGSSVHLSAHEDVHDARMMALSLMRREVVKEDEQ